AGAELAGREAVEPGAVALERRLVEAELGGQRLHRIRRRGRAEHHLGGVAGQDIEHHENDGRGGEQGRDESGEALEKKEADGGARSRETNEYDGAKRRPKTPVSPGRGRWLTAMAGDGGRCESDSTLAM